MSNYYGSNGFTIPTGAILPFVASTTRQIPDSYLYCNGGQYNSVLYPELFAVIGTSFNTGGETAGFFRVPDLVTNPYSEPGVFNPVPAGPVTVLESVALTPSELPNMLASDFTASIDFNPATSPSLYEHNNGNNTQGDNGTTDEHTKANSSTRTTFAVALTGGSASYTPPGVVTPAQATVTLGEVRPGGSLYIHIIKASQVSIAPQILAPAVVPQFPAPQYLYTNMAWLNGFTDFNF